MRILAISDEEVPALWDYYQPGRLDGYDLIISCGDLKPAYLEFLVTMAHVPVLYVHGNHDECYEREAPEGCECIDGRVVTYNGVRILGLGGCLRYHPGPFQYTESQMFFRILGCLPALLKKGGADIVVTHAPMRGIGDLSDPAHRGFVTLRRLIDRLRPAFFLHGHVHLRYELSLPRERQYGSTRVINASGRYAVEFPDRPFPEKQRGKIL